MKRTPLQRRTPLKRSPMKRRAKRRKDGEWPMAELRPFVMERDRGCVAARLWIEVDCTSRLHLHHVLMRSQGGRDVPDDCVMVCDAHHVALHANPERAYGLGLLRRRWG
jgi:hypothetical protein